MHWPSKKKEKNICSCERESYEFSGFENYFINTDMLLCQECVANVTERTTAKLYFVVVQKSYRGILTGGRNKPIKICKENKENEGKFCMYSYFKSPVSFVSRSLYILSPSTVF